MRVITHLISESPHIISRTIQVELFIFYSHICGDIFLIDIRVNVECNYCRLTILTAFSAVRPFIEPSVPFQICYRLTLLEV